MNNPVIKTSVTIGVTTYDRKQLLTESVRSILDQTYDDFRLVISNDNPDRYLTMSDLDIPNDKRVQIFNQPKNLGEIRNLNWLLNHASTPYFTWLADDDLLHPRFLELMYGELKLNPNCKVAYSKYDFGIKPSQLFYEALPIKSFTELSAEDFLVRYANRTLDIIGCYGLFDIEVLRAQGGFRQLGTGHSPGSDTLIPVLLSSENMIHYIDESLVFLRTHDDSTTWTSVDLSSYVTAESDFIALSSEVIESLPQEFRGDIYSGFQYWFQDNHAAVICRATSLNIFTFFKYFLTSERSNFYIFSSYKLGLMRNLKFCCRFVRIYILKSMQNWFFPKFRIRVKSIFQQKS
jgi:glycosyltransferase involved in cell wall biosynthesis